MVHLPEKLKQWIVSHFPGEVIIHHVYLLEGSTTATMYAIVLQLSVEKKTELVLRQYEKNRTAKDIEQEADSLKTAASLTVDTPQCIAVDPDGEVIGKPLLLMRKIEGKVNILPINQTEWLGRLAETLARIHDNSIENFPWKHERYQKADEIEIPAWSSKQGVWERLKEIAMQPEPSYKPIFIHRDFHPTNVLWKDGKVSGVVDWASSCLGHAGIDVGHCRWNLAMLYGVEAADSFLSAYQEKMGYHFSYNVYWDIVSLMDVLEDQPEVYPGWKVFGKTDITVEIMIERMDRYAVSLLEKADVY
ncbi:phosphotransferase family protein [Oceanobacillus jeddahense]|uniref:Aminoglycoside phosphotransferase family protein n=1 Tax=Oceanobacillus jeddahense TaxID=1462527 RepID=A0ABY5JV28_9BACI|nr:aminoglycoside phosphotransferase family protein [Oceanobacillus jeddahense]UUI04019.1 aminoglycoside phosphotransferase family protein [Oceanobacillus jeddahense]